MSNDKKTAIWLALKRCWRKYEKYQCQQYQYQQTKTGNAARTGGRPSQTVCGVKTARKGTHTNYTYIHIYVQKATLGQWAKGWPAPLFEVFCVLSSCILLHIQDEILPPSPRPTSSFPWHTAPFRPIPLSHSVPPCSRSLTGLLTETRRGKRASTWSFNPSWCSEAHSCEDFTGAPLKAASWNKGTHCWVLAGCDWGSRCCSNCPVCHFLPVCIIGWACVCVCVLNVILACPWRRAELWRGGAATISAPHCLHHTYTGV